VFVPVHSERAGMVAVTGARIVAVATALIVTAGCGDDASFRRTFPDGFPAGPVFGVDTSDPLRARWNLTGALLHYHVTPDAADCMVRAAFGEGTPSAPPEPSGRSTGPSRVFSGEELNAWARACGVEFSTLWTMTD
jgi:hypothetical protein